MLYSDRPVAHRILDVLQHKHKDLYRYFQAPAMSVLDSDLQVYYGQVVQKPRDLGTIRDKIDQEDTYSGLDEFKEDVLLCFTNAQLFCSLFKEFKVVKVAADTITNKFTKIYNDEMKKLKKERPNAGKGGARNRDGRDISTRSNALTRYLIKGFEQSIIDKVVKPLKTESGVRILLKPVDPSQPFYEHYMARIKEPMDFETLQKKLEMKAYEHIDEYLRDQRLIFSNALRYNCHQEKTSMDIRKSVMSILYKFESKWAMWNKTNIPMVTVHAALPELKICLSGIEQAFQMKSSNPNATPGFGPVMAFIDPVNVQLTEDALIEYKSVINSPVDYGTITERLICALYRSVDDFLSDISAVATNCQVYWSMPVRANEGGAYISDAKALREVVYKAVQEGMTKYDDLCMPRYIPSAPIDPPTRGRDRSSHGGGHHSISPPAGRGGDSNRRKSTGGIGGGGSGLSLRLSTGGVGSNHRAKSGKNKRASLGTGLAFQQAAMTIASAEAPRKVDDVQHSNGQDPVLAEEMAQLERETRFEHTLVKNNYFLPPEHQTVHESENQIQKRARKYVREMIMGCLDELMNHFLLNRKTKVKVKTVLPFVQAVDKRAIPEYHKWLAAENREEMNIDNMKRKLRNDTYGLSIKAVLEDMHALQDNAHGFNVGEENKEVRIMADCVCNYFVYLVKTCLSVLQSHSQDRNLQQAILTAENLPALDAPIAEDVTTYLNNLKEEHESLVQAKKEMKMARIRFKQEEAERARLAASPQPEDIAEGFVDGYDLMDLDLLGDDSGYADTETQAMQMQYMMPLQVREKMEWEKIADDIIKKIKNSPYVDPKNMKGKLIADFFRPVALVFPDIATEYNEIVKNPMDLGTLQAKLDRGEILDSEDFVENLVNVFKNLVDYNQRPDLLDHQKAFAAQMVEKGSALMRYAQWLCLEKLPIKSKQDEEMAIAAGTKPELLGYLRDSVREEQRRLREALIADSKILAVNPCTALLNQLKREKGNLFKKRMSWFCVTPEMPADYAVYVRKPMDLGKVSKNVATEPPVYHNYKQMIEDIRLVFKNALKYNAAHMNDPTSKEVYEAAESFGKKFEDILPEFTLNIAEKVERDRIQMGLEAQRITDRNSTVVGLHTELKTFEEEERKRRLADDANFALDQDVEKKMKRSEMESADYVQRERQRRFELEERNAELYGKEFAGTLRLMGAADASSSEDNMQYTRVRLQGVGYRGQMPTYMLPHAKRKVELRKALDRFYTETADSEKQAKEAIEAMAVDEPASQVPELVRRPSLEEGRAMWRKFELDRTLPAGPTPSPIMDMTMSFRILPT